MRHLIIPILAAVAIVSSAGAIYADLGDQLAKLRAADGVLFDEGDPERFFVVEPRGGNFGDIDGDGIVGTLDLLLLLGAWGDNPGHPADLNDDGNVGTRDLLILLGNWG